MYFVGIALILLGALLIKQITGMKYRKSTVAMGLPTLSEYEIWETDEQEFRECAQIVHSFGK